MSKAGVGASRNTGAPAPGRGNPIPQDAGAPGPAGGGMGVDPLRPGGEANGPAEPGALGPVEGVPGTYHAGKMHPQGSESAQVPGTRVSGPPV